MNRGRETLKPGLTLDSSLVRRLARIRDITALQEPGRRRVDRLRAASGGLTLLPVAFNLWVLRSELIVAQYLNDNAMHLQMVRWAQRQIQSGRIPLDGWYPYFGMGSAHFVHYQTLPHILTAYLSQIFGSDMTFRWILYLLLALWPICIFWTGRLFGLGTLASAAAAVLSPLLVSTPGHGYEHGSYVWHGYGIWAQLWGMWLLPLAWVLSWRAVTQKRSYLWAALALAAAVACHFLTGYLALLFVGLWPVMKPKEFLPRAGRALLLVFSALLIASWVVVPTALDGKWLTQSAFFRGTFFNDSYGAEKVLGWLFTGKLYDAGRLGAVTLLVGAGLVRCVRQWRQEALRTLAALWVASLLLFFGRPTLRPLINLLPFNEDVLFHRFIIGLHLSGLFLGGVGAAWLGGMAMERAKKARSKRAPAWAAVVVGGMVFLAPIFVERTSYAGEGARLLHRQARLDETEGADVEALITRAKRANDGRIYAGLRSNWGPQYRVGVVPVFATIANQDADGVGFTFRTASLSADIEAWFDESRASHYELFNVKYLLLPEDREPAVPAALLEERGRHVLWRVETTGYLSVVDTASSIRADRTNLAEKVLPFLHSNLPENKIHPLIEFSGAKAPQATLPFGNTSPVGDPGQVQSQGNRSLQGYYYGDVVANRPSVALLKASYDPRWSVFVDGRPATKQMVAPSFVGVRLREGRHRVEFKYVPFAFYSLLFCSGAAAAAALALWERPHLLPSRNRRDKIDGEQQAG